MTGQSITRAEVAALYAIYGDLAVEHSQRFRKVSNRYPRRVAEAYDGDLLAASGDPDDVVAAKVAAWEAAHGGPVRDWYAVGETERDPADEELTP